MGHWALIVGLVLTPLAALLAKSFSTFFSRKKDRRLEVRLRDGQVLNLRVEHLTEADLRELIDGLHQMDDADAAGSTRSLQ